MEGQSNKSLNKNMSRAAPMDSMQQPCILKAQLLWMQQFAITFKVSFNNLISFFKFTTNIPGHALLCIIAYISCT